MRIVVCVFLLFVCVFLCFVLDFQIFPVEAEPAELERVGAGYRLEPNRPAVSRGKRNRSRSGTRALGFHCVSLTSYFPAARLPHYWMSALPHCLGDFSLTIQTWKLEVLCASVSEAAGTAQQLRYGSTTIHALLVQCLSHGAHSLGIQES